jgi:YD repeat-containing protein
MPAKPVSNFFVLHPGSPGTLYFDQNPQRYFLTQITYSNGETSRTLSYDRLGRLLTAANAHATITRAYDIAGRMTSENQTLSGLAGSYVFSYGYDIDGLPTTMTRPDGSIVSYTHDTRAWLTSVSSDGPPPVAEYTYNGRGQIATTTLENGLFTATRSYDTAGRHTGVTNGALDTTAYTLSPDERTDWQPLTSDHLLSYQSSMSFMDAEGIRFHLPAWMLAELRDNRLG